MAIVVEEEYSDDSASVSSYDSREDAAALEKDMIAIERRRSVEAENEALTADKHGDPKDESMVSGPTEEELEQKRLADEKKMVEQETGEELIDAARKGNMDQLVDVLKFAEEEDLDIIDIRIQPLPGIMPDTHWSGFTALMAASRSGHSKIVAHMISCGSDLELFDFDRKMTPLMWAAIGNHVSAIRELGDADHEAKDIHGRTALLLACEKGHLEAVEALLLHSDVDAVDNGGNTALMYAVLGGHFRIAKLLCDYSADVDAIDKARRTPLMHAARWGFYRTLALLIDRGASIDERDKKGWTALMFACRWNKLPCVDVLIKKGAEVDIRDRSMGRNALLWAVASTKNLGIVNQLLLKKDEFDLAQTDIYGKTALDLAGSVEIEAALKDAMVPATNTDTAEEGDDDYHDEQEEEEQD